MSNLTKITDDLWAVVVPASTFAMCMKYYYLQWIYGDTVKDSYSDYLKLDGNYEILGTVSETEIDFDVKPFVDVIDEIDRVQFVETIYRDYIGDMVYYYSKNKSFLSLLKSKGITPTPETKIVILKKI